jgi:transcriptional regulator with XRE-family HTH domain
VLRRRRLAKKLRRMREEAGLTLTEAAPQMDRTKSALSRVENGETAADPNLVRTMMDVYNHYDPDLLGLAREALKPGWWHQYGIRDRGYIGFETDASAVYELSLMYIPGLLQTQDYVRALLSAGRLKRTRQELANQVKARMIRQRRLVDPDTPLTLHALIDEAALRKPIGGPDVRRAQLRHLIEQAELDTVTIQVLPDELGTHVGMDGAFIVLEFPEDEDPDLLYITYLTGALHVEKPQEVTEARLKFADLRSLALSPKDSVAFIERMVGEP